MAQIVSKYALPNRANIAALSEIPTPSVGEIILVNTDNEMARSGEGVFTHYIKGDGHTPANALPLISLDPEPEEKSNVLYRKILCCAGDSITYGDSMPADGIAATSDITMYQSDSSGNFSQQTQNFRKTWGFQIAERNKMTFYNAGVNGSTLVGLQSNWGFSLENGRYTKLPNNIDYLVITFGVNDKNKSSVGTITDTSNTTFYGAWNTVMPYLINKYPYTKICLFIPWSTSVDQRNAIRNIANKYGVACFDMFQAGTPLFISKESSVGVDASIVSANQAKYLAEGVHPNYQGHTQLADMLEHFLRGI